MLIRWFCWIFLAEVLGGDNLVVAHFEHGIRGVESERDLEFVRDLAKSYGAIFEFGHGNLGRDASEALARQKRYQFLRQISKKYGEQGENATIFTAHHKNDLAETFVLNLARGGGWRAIACLDSPDIARPFLELSKARIIEMARARNLDWREDSSNFEQKYTRNKIRQNVKFSEFDLDEIFLLWVKQVELRREIDSLVGEIMRSIFEDGRFERGFFSQNSDEVCFEVVREILRRQSGEIPLNKQVWDFLRKIRTFRPKTKTQILGGQTVNFAKDFFEFDGCSDR